MDELYERKIAPRKMKAHVTSIEASGAKQH